ncbi:MAG: hypothetical protein NC337_05560 [Roseburia sp.]|nr:hypothetical protein [Roseburia sp.]
MSGKKTLGFSLNAFVAPTSQDWYRNVKYEDAKNIIREKMLSSAENFVAIGYYLKHISENGQYAEDGYSDIWECAKNEFGFSQAQASRCINICKAYSVDGDSPFISERFKNFNKSQLQEMLPIKDEHLMERITPDMSVKEIRDVKNAEEGKEKNAGEDKALPGQMRIATIEGDFREFESSSSSDSDKALPEEKQSETMRFSCDEESIEDAIEFIFGSRKNSSFPQNTMDALVELFKKGNVVNFISPQTVFDKILPFENDTVEVSYQCGYLVRYIHTDESIKIPVYHFWKAFEKCYGWMWKEDNDVVSGEAEATDVVTVADGETEEPEEDCVSGIDLERVTVLLPCEAGETVYYCGEDGVTEGTVDLILLSRNMEPEFRVHDGKGRETEFALSDFGRRLFFTYDEALKRGG